MDVGELGDCSTDELADAMHQLAALVNSAQSQLLQLVAHYDGREAWREDGCTSMVNWLVARCGVAHRTAAEWVRVAHCLEDLPAIATAFSEAKVSFDQLAPLTRLAG